jgi:hypothetical protein
VWFPRLVEAPGLALLTQHTLPILFLADARKHKVVRLKSNMVRASNADAKAGKKAPEPYAAPAAIKSSKAGDSDSDDGSSDGDDEEELVPRSKRHHTGASDDDDESGSDSGHDEEEEAKEEVKRKNKKKINKYAHATTSHVTILSILFHFLISRVFSVLFPLCLRRPQELTTKQRVSRLRPCDISGITVRKTGMDPRFEGGAATGLDRKAFAANYSFLDDLKREDVKNLTAYVPALCYDSPASYFGFSLCSYFFLPFSFSTLQCGASGAARGRRDFAPVCPVAAHAVQ